MEDLKIWRIDQPAGQLLTAVALCELKNTETEKLLEDLLTTSPTLLEPGLRLIARQFQTDGGPLDLLGIDRNDRLVIFELKRGTLVRDAVAQALDYASSVAGFSPEAFAAQVTACSDSRGIQKFDDFASWYAESYGQPLAGLLKAPRVVLVGVGIDDATRRIVRHLASFGMEITAITFHAYEANGQLLLARAVEVDARDVPPTNVGGRTDWSQGSLERELMSANETLGSTTLFNDLRSLIASTFRLSRPGYANKSGVTFYLRSWAEGENGPGRYYARLLLDEDQPKTLYVCLPERAIRDGGEIVSELIRASNPERHERKGLGTIEFQMAVTAQNWESFKPKLEIALKSIVDGTERIFAEKQAEA